MESVAASLNDVQSTGENERTECVYLPMNINDNWLLALCSFFFRKDTNSAKRRRCRTMIDGAAARWAMDASAQRKTTPSTDYDKSMMMKNGRAAGVDVQLQCRK